MQLSSQLSCPESTRGKLDEWLNYLEQLHPSTIELGLSRCQLVLNRLQLNFTHLTTITVAGTNGKGTTCRFIEMALLAKGKKVGVYSSPHLSHYAERVRINDATLSDNCHCHAFSRVEQARQDTLLTYFEFGTLAALCLFAESDLDYLILEVGLGGRLDAVNCISPDIAVITGIDLDHQEWLGDNREAIGREKAGIFRKNGKVVIGDPDPPQSVIDQANQLNCDAIYQGKDFQYEVNDTHWKWQSSGYSELPDLPLPPIPIQNASTAIAALSLLDENVSREKLTVLIPKCQMKGRLHLVQLACSVLFDVAHNPQSCAYLADHIATLTYRRLHFVCAMMSDKHIAESLIDLLALNAHWYVCDLPTKRAASAEYMQAKVKSSHNSVTAFSSVGDALTSAQNSAGEQDLIVVFGSFVTVSLAYDLV
jgi:dihydrofolate synthase/folylpolyglutamate synthase